jgi:ribosomal protein S18 acetylase RimI-like enzyme
MQRLAVEQRRLVGPRAQWHVGDIAWQRWQHEGREDEWELRLWDDRAWSWLKLDKGTIDYDVHHDHAELLDPILDEPRARTAHAFEDDEETRAILARHGFSTPGEALHFYVRDLEDRPEPLPLPDGFRERTVEDADLAERVAIHRDVWAPSRVTESSYANVRAAWPYRASLDCVIEAPDGRFAAYALLWPDDANGVGELEPVGVRAEFRRQGLGAAVCTAALARWHDEGGREAIVYCLSDSACALYESVGFRRHATLVAYTR